MLPEIQEREDNTENQAPLENSARPRQAEDFLGIPGIVRDIAQKKDQLGPDKGDENYIERGVDDSRSIQALLFCLDKDKPQRHAYAQGHHKAIGMNGDRPNFQ
jgi:hypothetical protein